MKLPFFLEETNYHQPPYILSANPHCSDYIHVLYFHDDNSFEMVEGSGQTISGKAIGNYQITVVDESLAIIELDNLVELNVYQGNKKVRDLEPTKLNVLKEERFFAFGKEAASQNLHKPCLLYEVRYVFNVDPLAFARNNPFSPYQTDDFSGEAFSEDATRYYYALNDKREVTSKRLFELGVRRSEFVA